MISTRKRIVVDKHGIRLNNPGASGIWFKIDRFIFGYGRSFGLPCFIPSISLKNQLVVDGKPVFSGGGMNCFGEKLEVWPVIVDAETLKHCKEAYEKKRFKIRNFQYNGFFGQELPGYTKYEAVSLEKTNDPGVYRAKTSTGKEKYIPSFAIEGVQILYKINDSQERPDLFGVASNS